METPVHIELQGIDPQEKLHAAIARHVAQLEKRFGRITACRVAGSGRDRRWLRSGAQLLNDAGFALKNGKRLMPDGKPITMEFLLDEATFTPHHLPYIKNLGVLGINATLRVVDPVQYRARVDGFDFDITVERFSFSATPGDSLRTYFSSQAAATKGSQNLAGIADPAVDALVDIIIARQDAPRAHNRVQGARPRHPRRALLDSALVQSVTLDRFLGRVRPPRRQTAQFPGHSGNLVVRQGQGSQVRPERLSVMAQLAAMHHILHNSGGPELHVLSMSLCCDMS